LVIEYILTGGIKSLNIFPEEDDEEPSIESLFDVVNIGEYIPRRMNFNLIMIE
jgi:hypothetical protein